MYKVSVEWLGSLIKCDSSGSAGNVGQDWDQGWCFLSPIHWGEQAEEEGTIHKRAWSGAGEARQHGARKPQVCWWGWVRTGERFRSSCRMSGIAFKSRRDC